MKDFLSVIVLVTMMLSVSVANAASYGENYDGLILYASIVKNGDNYTLNSISPSPKGGNVRLNDLAPNFNTAERKCGIYFANGSPSDSDASACETLKDTEFINVSINTVSNLFLTAFSLGTNVLTGGKHLRHGKFDEDAYKKVLGQIFENGQVNRKKIIEDYTYFVQRDEALADVYKANLGKLKVNFSINDKTGFFKKPPMDSYVLNATHIPAMTSNPPMLHQEFTAFYDKAAADNFLANKYAKIDFSGYSGYIAGFGATLDPAITTMSTTPTINVVANITEKSFSNIFPKFKNEDRFLKIDFDGNNLNFENKTENFVQILSISMYYGSYIKTITLTNNPIELAPQGSTIDPLTCKNFSDSKLQGLSTYKSITAAQARGTTLNFGFAIKYRVVEQNTDMTQYKTIKYNLHDLLANAEEFSNALSNTEPTRGIQQAKQPRRVKKQL